MAVKIRLMRMGKLKWPYYRIVAIDERKSRNSEYLDRLGHFSPLEKDPVKMASLDTVKFSDWLKKGAQATDIVKKIFAQLGNKWSAMTPEKPKAEAKAGAKEKTGRKKKYHPIAKRVKKEKKAKKVRPPKTKKKAAKTA